jgi:hypothetical protein
MSAHAEVFNKRKLLLREGIPCPLAGTPRGLPSRGLPRQALLPLHHPGRRGPRRARLQAKGGGARATAAKGPRDGPPRWAPAMGPREGPPRRAPAMGPRDGPPRWAPAMGPHGAAPYGR